MVGTGNWKNSTSLSKLWFKEADSSDNLKLPLVITPIKCPKLDMKKTSLKLSFFFFFSRL